MSKSAEYARKWRQTPKGKQYVRRSNLLLLPHSPQAIAIKIVNGMVKKGVLPKPSKLLCIDCWKDASVYDHRDYSKPLHVEPVCRACNLKRGPAK